MKTEEQNLNKPQRSSISIVRDFGAIHCPPTAKFLRSKKCSFLAIQPALRLYNVTCWLFYQFSKRLDKVS